MKGAKLLAELRVAGITGTDITLTGPQAEMITSLIDDLIMSCATGSKVLIEDASARVRAILLRLQAEVQS